MLGSREKDQERDTRCKGWPFAKSCCIYTLGRWFIWQFHAVSRNDVTTYQPSFNWIESFIFIFHFMNLYGLLQYSQKHDDPRNYSKWSKSKVIRDWMGLVGQFLMSSLGAHISLHWMPWLSARWWRADHLLGLLGWGIFWGNKTGDRIRKSWEIAWVLKDSWEFASLEKEGFLST